MKAIFKFSAIIIIASILGSCTSISTESPTISTPTEYIPVTNGTPIPLVYETITPETVRHVTLLARWKFDTWVERLGSTPNMDVFYADSRKLALNWDIYRGEIEQELAASRTAFTDEYSAAKVVFPDNHFLAYLDSGTLIIKNLLKPTRYLYYSHIEDAISVALFSDGQTLAVAFPNGQIWLIKQSQWKERLLTLENEKAKAESTAIAQSLLTPPSSAASLPSTPTSSLPAYQSQAPLSWPLLMPTTNQIMEARNCSIESLASSRYPNVMNYWEFENAFSLELPCDWAVLATAYQSDPYNKSTVSEEGKRAFFESIKQNPAFAMTKPLFYRYFNSMEIVEAPPLAKQPITSIIIDYEWYGLGDPSHVSYHIEIDKANTSADEIVLRIDGLPESYVNTKVHSIDPEKIQEVGKSLTNLLPIQSPFALQNCIDNNPDWKINLTFYAGSKLTLKTHASTFFDVGGPWFMELEGHNYIQFSSTLVNTVVGLFDILELPLGQSYAMTCSSVDIFELAYP